MFAIGLFENGSAVARNHGRQNANVTSEAHNTAARELATAGTVLLQNKRSVLPLDPTAISSVAVIGGAAAHETGDGAPNNPGTDRHFPKRKTVRKLPDGGGFDAQAHTTPSSSF